jgi:hypothetical protein
MAVAYIGSVGFEWLGDFTPRADATPVTLGTQKTLFGVAPKKVALSLWELVGNPDRRVNLGEEIGVIAWIWVQRRPELFGPWLLQSFRITADHVQQLRGWQSFDVNAIYLAGSQTYIIRSARERENDFSLAAKSLLVQPFWGAEGADPGQPFAADPGGTVFAREYDPRTGYDPGELEAESRWLRIHEGVLT